MLRSSWNSAVLTARWQLRSLVLCGLLSCRVSDPFFPASQVEKFEPKPIFELWWQLVENCSGIRRDFSSVTFYRSLGELIVDGKSVAGYWSPEGNRIALAGIGESDGRVVRHEMLHAILQTGNHPLTYFAGRCDGVVSFDAPEDYGVSDATADTVNGPSVLSVTITPLAESLAFSRHAGNYLLRISAVNTASRAMWVRVPPNQLRGGYFLEGDFLEAGTHTKASRVFFAAGQRRELLLDAQVAYPGTVHVRGLFLGATSPWTTFTIP